MPMAPFLTLTWSPCLSPDSELPSVVIIGGENITAPFLRPLTLQCAGAGVPTPSLRWWKDGVALAASGGNLQVRAGAPGLGGNLAQVEGLLFRGPGSLEAVQAQSPH